ncbi:hypothetical protein [Streptomyces sp. NPDC051572]|uniref:hypothetical protein n=1 Tax=Streptomyces sp. NPDC051572 TaxID=3155802 RepID=UPI00345025B2
MDDTDITASCELPWLVIRQDDKGRQFRVGRYATHAEAEKINTVISNRGNGFYWVESLSGHIFDALKADAASNKTGRRLRRARPLFEALTHILPADARARWSEEWTAEWLDLGEQPLRTRVGFLLRVTLLSGPYFAWTLRLTARRQRAQ